MLIYKIFRGPEWAELRHYGVSAGAPIDIADGYVHMSGKAQVRETCEKHFAGEDGLVILAIESDTLGSALRWETSRGGALFPHLYRSLRMSDVVWHHPLPLGENGHDFPDGIA